MVFADVSDLEARWRTLDDDEAALAAALLADASAKLEAAIQGRELDAGYRTLLKIAACNMVRRAIAPLSQGTFLLSQESVTAGPYTQQRTYRDLQGDLRISRDEMRMLGIGTGYIGSIRAKVGPC